MSTGVWHGLAERRWTEAKKLLLGAVEGGKDDGGPLFERLVATEDEWVQAYLLLGRCAEAGRRLPEAAEFYAQGLRYRPGELALSLSLSRSLSRARALSLSFCAQVCSHSCC
eukprot:COSAG05_NODE_8648_length_684_cov_1.442735_2_plen_112_part_00